MPRLKSANNATTNLTVAITAIDELFSVADASIFPDAPFRITIDAEIMEVGAIDKVGNVFSNVLRGMEGTAALNHNADATVDNRWTAGTYAELASDLEMQAIRLRSYAGVY